MKIEINNSVAAESLCQLRRDYRVIFFKLREDLLAPILATKKFDRVCGKTWNVPGWRMGELSVRLGADNSNSLVTSLHVESLFKTTSQEDRPDKDFAWMGDNVYAEFLLYHPKLGLKKLIRGTCELVLYLDALDIVSLDLYRSDGRVD
jgi:hypothetical protein